MSELTTSEDSKIFAAVESSDLVLLRTTLDSHCNVNVFDDNLMTPLQHAAYKGSKDMVQMLLDYGADPNLCKHQHNYTALHFGGLSGNVDVCLALLIAGAQPNVTNTVNRTAAQMAAFVGHHKCVAIINNYIEKSEVDYYTVIQGCQTEPYLSSFLAESFHKFIIQVNIHPVKIALNIYNYIGLAQHLQQIKQVLDLMYEKEMKKESGINEIIAFKLYYLSYIVSELKKIEQKRASEENKKIDIVQIFCKNILKPNSDGSLQILDAFLRECIKQFPYTNSTLLRQMVTTLTGKDVPTALSVVSSAINGQRGFIDNVPICSTCGEEKPSKKCSQCKVTQYCDKNCQKLHWYWHKKMCAKLAEQIQTNSITEKLPVDVSELSSELQNMLGTQ